MSAHARLSLEGTEQPIVARVESSRGGAIVVGRKLPFLRLGAKVVDELGREGAIRQVSLRIEDGVPHLSLELEYEERKEPPPPAVLASSRPPRRDPTLGYESRASRPPAPAEPPSKDATNHDATLGYAPTEKVQTGFRPSLAPMPLPIPEAPTTAPIVARSPSRVPAWLVALASFLVAWLRPFPLLGAR